MAVVVARLAQEMARPAPCGGIRHRDRPSRRSNSDATGGIADNRPKVGTGRLRRDCPTANVANRDTLTAFGVGKT